MSSVLPPHMCVPGIQAGSQGLEETTEDLAELFKDVRAPIQLAVLTGGPGKGITPFSCSPCQNKSMDAQSRKVSLAQHLETSMSESKARLLKVSLV